MDNDTADAIAQAIFGSDHRVTRVRVYLDGYVARSYRYRAPGTGVEYIPVGATGALRAEPFAYDRRSYARGPRAVGYSDKGSAIVSER